MAKVFDSSMVAHVWAQQTQAEGSNNGGSLYFNGQAIYSYGGHFMAGFALSPRGPFLINADSPSKTTGKHLSYVRRAVPHGLPCYILPDLTRIADSVSRLHRGGSGIPAHHAADVRRYLDSVWQRLSPEAGAFLYGLVSRGTWEAYRARKQAKADRQRETALKADRQRNRKAAADFAALSLPMIRARMVRLADCDDWQRAGRLQAFVTDLYHAHRGAGGKRIKAAMWERLQYARGLASRLSDAQGRERREMRAALAGLRQLNAGEYGSTSGISPARLAVAMADAERSRLLRLLRGAHMPPAIRERWNERAILLADVIAGAERVREAERMAEQAERRAAWLAGQGSAYARDLLDERGGALIRAEGVELDGCQVMAGELVTSQGARVPLSHAVRVFAFVRHVRETGTGWNMTGQSKRTIRVGHFTLSHVEPSGDFVAGCHRINWNETERLARELGVWDCPAEALASPDAEAA